MLLKIFGILDILVGIVFLLNNNFDKLNSWFPNTIILLAGVYLILKGIFFLIFGDFASIMDIICAIIILLSLAFSMPLLLAGIVFIFLVQKGFFSMVS